MLFKRVIKMRIKGIIKMRVSRVLKIHHNPKSARVVIVSPTMYINANKVIKITTLIKSSGK